MFETKTETGQHDHNENAHEHTAYFGESLSIRNSQFLQKDFYKVTTIILIVSHCHKVLKCAHFSKIFPKVGMPCVKCILKAEFDFLTPQNKYFF